MIRTRWLILLITPFLCCEVGHAETYNFCVGLEIAPMTGLHAVVPWYRMINKCNFDIEVTSTGDCGGKIAAFGRRFCIKPASAGPIDWGKTIVCRQGQTGDLLGIVNDGCFD